MLTLSVRQPYATLILYGLKQFETRSSPITHRGPIAIHSSRNTDTLAQLRQRHYHFFYAAQNKGLTFPLGVILGTVRILDCLRASNVFPSPQEQRWGYWTHVDNMWAWQLHEPELLNQPVPWYGRLGLFETPDTIYLADAYGPPPTPTAKKCPFPF